MAVFGVFTLSLRFPFPDQFLVDASSRLTVKDACFNRFEFVHAESFNITHQFNKVARWAVNFFTWNSGCFSGFGSGCQNLLLSLGCRSFLRAMAGNTFHRTGLFWAVKKVAHKALTLGKIFYFNCFHEIANGETLIKTLVIELKE